MASKKKLKRKLKVAGHKVWYWRREYKRLCRDFESLQDDLFEALDKIDALEKPTATINGQPVEVVIKRGKPSSYCADEIEVDLND